MARKKAPSARKPARAKANGTTRRPAATARISASVEKELLKQAEAFARARRTTVAALVAEGLRKVIGAEKVPVLPPGDLQTTAVTDAPSDGPWGQLLAWMEEQQETLTEIRIALGDVSAYLPNDAPPDTGRAARGTRIPPP
jgi:hypothetical protein